MHHVTPLRAGFARTDITPDAGIRLIGYSFRYEEYPSGHDGVHDPLFARALVFDDGAGPAAIVSLDLATLETPLARDLRQTIAHRLKTDAARVIVSCTHTHSGPFPQLPAQTDSALREDAIAGDDPDSPDRKANVRYYEHLKRQVQLAVVRAAGLLTPVTLERQEAPLGLGFNRRIPDGKGGVRHCWNPQEQADLPLEPSADSTCSVLVLRQTHGPRRYVLWCYGAHNLALGKTSNVISADWAGAANGVIEDLLPDSSAMFLLGACGDVHPWISTQDDPANLRPIATAAGGFVATLAHATRPVALSEPMRVASRTVAFGKVELDLTAWRLGDVRIVAAPVELFAGLAAALRQRVPGPLVLITEANGRSGYWPTEAAFAQGHYEVDIARSYGLNPGDGERLVEHLAQLVAELA